MNYINFPKILCFPFAGGNQYSYKRFLPENILTLAHERNYDSLEILITEHIRTLTPILSKKKKFYIYGHSMGAQIAYLLCLQLQKLDLPMPQKLIVSGKKAPSISRKTKISDFSDDDFWNEVVSLGGIPDEMKNYPELIEYYLPILRHDFRLVETYQYENKAKLNIPIDVFYGSEEAAEEEMLGWQEETTQKVNITQFPGNHFFIFDHVEYFRNYFDNLIHQNKC